ncbi:recombinase RecT [Acidaminococcus intestini]|jgi:recombination protein RecT|uniref:recombinase RecT n=1 Tax=Acidaminococcus intestini TaxID=187327 RepID=UPI00041DF0FF|nr:recombinase RecT [Acidaminococcus intestini]DAH03734.1 MAG TPA: RecT protein [Caudoviricetes sp.]
MNTKGGLTKKTAERQEAQQEIQQKGATLKGLIKAMEPQIRAALPSVLTPERFTRMIFTALSTNPDLKECTPQSFLGAMMQAAQLGVEPNTPLGQAYLIRYNRNVKDEKGNVSKVPECQFQLGYKGFIDLAYRSEAVLDIAAHTIYSGDYFEFEYGFEPKLVHKPALTNRGTPVAYYAVYHTKDGGGGFEVMSQEDVERHRDEFSKAAQKSFSPWQTNFEEMAKKTVLKKLLKYAPLKTEFVRAISTDETVKSSILPDMADQPNEMEYADIEVEGTADQQVETTIDPDTPFTPEELGDSSFVD